MASIPGGRHAAAIEEKRQRVRRKARALANSGGTMGLTAFTKACGVGIVLAKQVLAEEGLERVLGEPHKGDLP